MLLDALLNTSLLAADPFAYFSDILWVIVILGVVMLIGFTIHEFSHAFVANLLGDTTAKRLGRLTLNPKAHLDPVGALMLAFAGFGWGKPVPVNPYYLRGGMARGMALVSLAGPASNVLLAAVAAMAIRFGPLARDPSLGIVFAVGSPQVGSFLLQLVESMVYINVLLAVFNLIPISPLDGFKVALGVLPRELGNSLARTEQYGMAILVLLFAFDFTFHVGIFSRVISPIVLGIYRLLVFG